MFFFRTVASLIIYINLLQSLEVWKKKRNEDYIYNFSSKIYFENTLVVIRNDVIVDLYISFFFFINPSITRLTIFPSSDFAQLDWFDDIYNFNLFKIVNINNFK